MYVENSYVILCEIQMFEFGARFRPCLHETGTKSNRHEFVSVIVLFIIDVYMRQG